MSLGNIFISFDRGGCIMILLMVCFNDGFRVGLEATYIDDGQFVWGIHLFRKSIRLKINSFQMFLVEDEPSRGTDRLLDCIQIKLSDMEIYSGLKIESRQKDKIAYVAQGEKMMIKPCFLDLVLERNLEWAFGRQGNKRRVFRRQSQTSTME